MLKRITKDAVVIVALGISACASTPPTNFYVLESLSPMTVSSRVDELERRQIGVGPITLPALLERKQIVTRIPPNGIQVAEFHQWAEPIKDNVARVLMQNLSKLQPNNIFRTYPWSAYGTVNYRVIIDIVRFDAQPGKSANLEATWAMMNEKNHQIVKNGKSTIERTLSDTSYPATINALSQILGEFSLELSSAIQAI